ncbi:MAG: sigma factor-like helix-turn-helix DNA-binding protein [Candidatus Heimdallarchaeaceae archaeon]
MDDKQQEELKERTKFRTKIRNIEKKEIFDAEVYLEYDVSSEEIGITIHDLRGYTDEFYFDLDMQVDQHDEKDVLIMYIADYWENRNLPFEFFYLPEVPRIIKLGEQEYLVYTMKEEKGLNYKEIAQVLKIAESTARGQYRNAKAKMEEELEL